MLLKRYKKCIFCDSEKLILNKNQNFSHNFYTKSIQNDLGIDDKFFKKMKVYSCQNCYTIQNNPWFSRKTSFRIFNQIYGQHNRNWSNVINFFKNGKKPDHGKLFEIIKNNIKVKNYCEFNVPFMGLMLDFFSKEYRANAKFYKNIFQYSLKYLSSRQVSGLKTMALHKKQNDAKRYFRKLNELKNKNFLNKKIKKSILIDNSYLSWLYNDNYKSVNSRSLASELIDVEFENFNLVENSKYYDLFGIFHTLDHTHQPKEILDYALNKSAYVIIYFHTDENIEKQHLFSFSEKFIKYLNKNRIYFQDLTLKIDKKSKSKEAYILCSKFNKININV